MRVTMQDFVYGGQKKDGTLEGHQIWENGQKWYSDQKLNSTIGNFHFPNTLSCFYIFDITSNGLTPFPAIL